MSKRLLTSDDILHQNDEDSVQKKFMSSRLLSLEEIRNTIKQGDFFKLTEFIDDGRQFNKKHKCHKYFYYSCEFGQLDCARLLLTRVQERRLYLDTEKALINATKLGHIEIVKLIINSAIQPISKYSQYSAFCHACRCGHLEMVKLLQSHYNFDINMRLKTISQSCRVYRIISHYSSPLVDACEGGSLEVVRFLIDIGARVVAAGTHKIPLNLACTKGHVDIVRELLINLFEQFERDEVITDILPSALIEAVDMGHNKMVQLLIDSGADVNIPVQEEGQTGETALHRACESSRISTARILLECGADVNSIGQGNMYILHSLFGMKESECIEMIKLLFEYNVNVDVICADTGHTALRKAYDILYTECIHALLAYGADVNLADQIRITPLMQACMAKTRRLYDCY